MKLLNQLTIHCLSNCLHLLPHLMVKWFLLYSLARDSWLIHWIGLQSLSLSLRLFKLRISDNCWKMTFDSNQKALPTTQQSLAFRIIELQCSIVKYLVLFFGLIALFKNSKCYWISVNEHSILTTLNRGGCSAFTKWSFKFSNKICIFSIGNFVAAAAATAAQ